MKRILTLVVILLTTITFAQKNDSINKLQDVFINGVRSGKTTPVTEKTIYRNDIQKTYQGTEVSSLLSKTPNVTISSDNGTQFGYTYFRLRGIDQTKINMTLNGVPLNEPEDQGVFFSNLPNFTDNIQSVEFQRGVGTSTNGVSSFAGSINFNSPNGFDKGGNIKYTAGSFNTNKVSATYSTGLNRNLALYTNISTYTTDGYRYGTGGKGSSLFMSGGYYGDKNNVKLTFFTGTSNNGMAWQPVSESDINTNPKTNYNSENAWDSFLQTFTQVEVSNKLNSNLNLSSSLFYNRLDGSYDYAMMGDKNLSLKSDFYGAISNLSLKTENSRIDFGVSANSYTRHHNYTFVDGENNKGVKKEFSSYIKFNQTLGKLVLSTDLQVRHSDFDYYGSQEMDEINWNFFNPKVGVMYNFTNKTNAYFTVGKSHREPTRTNLFYGNDYLIDFNNVKPESVIDYEFGVNHVLNKLYLQANIFYMNFNDEIALIGGTTPSGVSLTQSVEKSFRSGLELDIKYKISNSLKVKYNYSFTYAKVLNDNEEFYNILTPKNISNLVLSYEKNNFLFEIISKNQCKSYLDLSNQNSIKAFTVLNTNIGYTLSKCSILLSLNNLTSEKYYTNGSMVDRNFSLSNEKQLFSNPKINGLLTFKYNF